MDPTAGVDVKAKAALLGVVERWPRRAAILVVCGELEDLRTCDRVLVMRHGAIVSRDRAGWTDNELVASIEGIDHSMTTNEASPVPASRIAPQRAEATGSGVSLRDLALVPA